MMKKASGLYIVLTLSFVFCSVVNAEAAAISFQNFTARSGVTVDVPYQVNGGTEYDPDTVTLAIDLRRQRRRRRL